MAHRSRTFDRSVDLQLIGFLRESLADLREQFSAAGRVAPVLASDEAGFGLTLGEDMVVVPAALTR